jgi:hypothetical protein
VWLYVSQDKKRSKTNAKDSVSKFVTRKIALCRSAARLYIDLIERERTGA